MDLFKSVVSFFYGLCLFWGGGGGGMPFVLDNFFLNPESLPQNTRPEKLATGDGGFPSKL